MPKNRLAAVGAFVILGLLLFAVGLFLIGNRRMLFTRTLDVYAEFNEVAALDVGAKVRVSGMDAGEVEEIRVPPGPAGRFRVRMRVREDLLPLVRIDSVASIQNDGLVGNKFVQIDTGTEASPQVAAGGTVQSREPLDVADLMQMLSDTIVTVNGMLVDVKARVDEALVALAGTADDARTLMNTMGSDVRTIIATSNRIAADFSTILAGVRQGRGTVGRLLNDDSLFASVKAIAADAEKTMATVREATAEARSAIADLRGDGGPVKGLTGDVQHTLRSARDAMADLAEATEAVKRNFLFRGFFNRRGYFDLDDVSVVEYREGALETNDRRALRIWLAADRVFTQGADGMETLSEDGMARLDSAMGMFLRFPQRYPFVLEGYARGHTAAARHLDSRRRAELVRDYLVAKFKLDTNFVAIMPMGDEAEGSPSGDHWDGVALAMFVPTALTQSSPD
jgi:phospholipid/cholesterol/gamma-HCH transport system substrate-binding protein